MHSLLICIRIMHKIFLNSTLVLHIILHTLVWILARVVRALSWKKYICMHSYYSSYWLVVLILSTIYIQHTSSYMMHVFTCILLV